MKLACCLAFALTLAAPLTAQETAGARLRGMQDALRGLTALAGRLEVAKGQGDAVALAFKLRLRRPNMGRITAEAPVGYELISRGDAMWERRSAKSPYMPMDPGLAGEHVRLRAAPIVEYFFDPASLDEALESGNSAELTADSVVNGVACRGLKLTLGTKVIELAIGPDGIPLKITITAAGQPTHSSVLSGILKDPTATEDDFKSPATAGHKVGEQRSAPLLAVGTKAPPLDLPKLGGGRLLLEDVLKDKKPVALLFWFNGCPYCRKEMRELDTLACSPLGKRFQVVAVNCVDSADKVAAFFKKEGYTFPVGLAAGNPALDVDALRDRYQVKDFPTTYVVNADGRIAFRSLGFNKAGLIRSLAVRGVR